MVFSTTLMTLDNKYDFLEVEDENRGKTFSICIATCGLDVITTLVLTTIGMLGMNGFLGISPAASYMMLGAGLSYLVSTVSVICLVRSEVLGWFEEEDGKRAESRLRATQQSNFIKSMGEMAKLD